MPGYLDQYGAGEEQRNRIIIRSIVSIVAIVIVAALGWYLLKNHHQEGVVKSFVDGCPKGRLSGRLSRLGLHGSRSRAPAYSFDSFMSDWGAAAKNNTPPDPGVIGITDSESCNTGVLLTVAVNNARTEKLWVDKSERCGSASRPTRSARTRALSRS